MMRTPTPLVRPVVLVGALSVATWVLGHVAWDRAPGLLVTGSDPAQAVVCLAAGAGALLTAWLLAAVLLTVAAEAPGMAGRLATTSRDVVAPVLLRRWAAVAVGLSASVAVAPTATAAVTVVDESRAVGDAPRTSPGFTPTDDLGTGSSRPGWVPHRPATRSRAEPGLVTGPTTSAGRTTEVVVQRGDSLWSIAARALGPGATDLEIADAWPRWHAANRELVGDDPDLIQPGTRLRAPSPPEETP